MNQHLDHRLGQYLDQRRIMYTCMHNVIRLKSCGRGMGGGRYLETFRWVVFTVPSRVLCPRYYDVKPTPNFVLSSLHLMYFGCSYITTKQPGCL